MSRNASDLPPDDFGPLLPGPAFGGAEHVTKVLYNLGCFHHAESCPKCNGRCTLRSSTKTKKLKTGQEKEYVEFALRCTTRKCQAVVRFVDNTIWSVVKDRVLFVYAVNAFLNRSTTQSIANDTGCKLETAEKYLRIIKNALFLENEEEKRHMMLGGRG